MRVAVGSTAQGGPETLLQSVTGKAPGGTYRSHVKQLDKSHAQAEEASQQTASAEVDASETTVEQTEKTSKRKHGKAGSSEDDASFEDTFDSIGQDASNDDKGKKVGNPQTVLTNLPIVQQAGRDARTSDAHTDQKSPEKSQAVMRSASLLRQESILALMDAKDRIFSNIRDGAAVGKPVEQAASRADGTTDTVTPISIDRQETHWNFDNKAVAGIATQVSALRMDGSAPSQIGAQIRTASDAVAAITTKQPTARGDVAAVSTGSPQKAQSQTIAVPDIEPPSSQSFGGNADASAGNSDNSGQAGAHLQSSASADPAERKITKSDSSPSIDQIFTANAKPAQVQTSPTEQLRNGVLDNLSGNNIDPTASASSPGAATRPAAAPVLRTLDLTLSPDDLGSVKLRLSLKANSLSIEAEASKASTAKLLSDDRVSLDRGLRDAGYDVSSIKITDASASSSTNSSNGQMGGSPSRDGDPARSAFAGHQDGEMQRRDGSTFHQSQRRQPEDHTQATTADVNGSKVGNGLYI